MSNDNLIWLPHSGGRCPVSFQAMGVVRLQDGRELSYGLLGAAPWDDVTAFRIFPDQPPQLDGPLEVGARYIRRDGRIQMIEGLSACGRFVLLNGEDAWYTEKSSTADAGRFSAFGERPEDLLARYYPDEPAAVDGMHGDGYYYPAIKPAKEHADDCDCVWCHCNWLNARIAKCEANAPKDKPAACKPCNRTSDSRIARALSTVANDRNTDWNSGSRMGGQS